MGFFWCAIYVLIFSCGCTPFASVRLTTFDTLLVDVEVLSQYLNNNKKNNAVLVLDV